MATITLTVDDRVLEEAQQAFAAQHTTLDAAFEKWLAKSSAREHNPRFDPAKFDEIMERTKYVRSDRKYTREELNER